MAMHSHDRVIAGAQGATWELVQHGVFDGSWACVDLGL